MKTAIIASPLIASAGMEGSVMGMDASGASMAQYFLRDKIYSNKIRAVVREYASNAIDEHLKYKVQRSVEISLRKVDDKTQFSVRDFAKGLSENDIRSIFGMYFKSTKAGENKSIGGFGIGSKAFHCYVDTFYVDSFFEGTKTTYACVLGGSETGIPIGHIYKVNESPTEESGLEVYGDVEDKDIYSFGKEIRDFVKYSTADIVFLPLSGEKEFPFRTVWSKKINGYNFRLVHGELLTVSSQAIVQMGGVCYSKSINLPVIQKSLTAKSEHQLIVDLPIGSMSLPISRENFENVPLNNEVLAKVEEIIKDLAEKDLKPLATQSFSDLVAESLKSPLIDRRAEGQIFSISKANLLGDFWHAAFNLRFSGEVNNPIFQRSKPVLIGLKNNLAKKYWIRKMNDFAKEQNVRIIFASENSLYHYRAIYESYFEIAEGKILKIKTPQGTVSRQKGRYAVYNGNQNPEYLTALELAQQIASIEDSSLSDCTDADKLKAAIIKAASKTTSEKGLAEFVIGERYNQKLDSVGYSSSSLIFIQQAESYGVIAWGSALYKEHMTRIKSIAFEKEEHHRNISNATKNWFKTPTKTSILIKKSSRNARRMSAFWKAIEKEQSVRGKIFRAMNRQYLSSEPLTREEMKKVLSLK